MSKLGEAQEHFSLMLGQIIIFAYEKGFKIRMGDVFAKTGHKKNSAHYSKLAADLNLFKNGEWLVDGRGHDVLHDEWDKMGGAPRIEKDMNHYALEFEGNY